MRERLQKILSAQGIASRRKAEEYIEQGLVKVNGKVAKLGDKADPETDTIDVDGKILSDRQEMHYYLMNKPVGVETSNVIKNAASPEGSEKMTVRDLLPENLQGKIFPVGRLDKDSNGLLLFTNDGVLAYRLTHPKFDHEKEYEVTVDRPIPNMILNFLAEGIKLRGEDKMTKPATVRKIAPRTFRITLTEGKNRQIRRMCQNEGFTVKELRRVRIMTLSDDKLADGAIRPLKETERKKLLASVGITNA